MIVEVSPTNSVVLDSSGNGRCAIGPPSGTKWALKLATGSVSTSTLQPTLAFYRGSASGPIELIDSTFTGAQGSSGKVGGAPYFPGQLLWAVWTGGDPGARATLTAFGQQGARSDPLASSPIGEGFANSSAIVQGNEIIIGSPSSPPYRKITTTIPSELVTWGNANNITFKLVDLFYYTATKYMWDAMITTFGIPVRMQGTYDTTNGPVIVEEMSIGASSVLKIFGSSINASGLTFVEFSNTELLLFSNSPFLIDNSGQGISQGRGTQVGYGLVTGGSVATSAGAEVAIPAASWANEPSFTFAAGRLYRTILQYGIGLSAAAQSTGLIKIRKGSASTAGQILGFTQIMEASNQSFVSKQPLVAYIKNATAADITTALSVTITRTAGAANISLYGDATTVPFTLTIDDYTDKSHVVGALAVAIT